MSNAKKFLTSDLIWKVTEGLSVSGSYDPEESMYIYEESLTFAQASVMWKFLAWVHENGKTFGRNNMVEVLEEFYQVADDDIKSYIDGKEVELDLSNFTLTETPPPSRQD